LSHHCFYLLRFFVDFITINLIYLEILVVRLRIVHAFLTVSFLKNFIDNKKSRKVKELKVKKPTDYQQADFFTFSFFCFFTLTI